MKRIHLLLLMAVLLFTGCQPKSELEFNVNGVTFKMIRVEGGTFSMKTPDIDGYLDNMPAHQVTLSDYYIGQTEVTQELWTAVMGANPSYYKNPMNPVEQVSWDDIVNDFIPKLNEMTGRTFTLPTDAQWEYAAKGGNIGQNFQYSGSDNIDGVAWYIENSNDQAHPVAQKLPNELELYDMTGNVSEWCSDWETDLFNQCSAEVQIDPIGPTGAFRRVVRGSGFDSKAKYSHIFNRLAGCPDVWDASVGFRLVLSDIMTFNRENSSVVKGDSQNLNVLINGITPVNIGLKWSSSNPDVVSVDSNGKVTSHVEGTTVITVKSNKMKKELSCNVEVLDGICIIVDGVKLPLVKVKGGTFTMGATPEQGRYICDDEIPAHQVTLSDYYIGQTEVTQELWETVMGSNPSKNKGSKNPVEQVSWDDIVNEFLPKLNALTGKTFSLPTEAQWEFAARGGNKTKAFRFSGGNDIGKVAYSYREEPNLVGQKLPNELGIYDMSGNVCEWCSDRYGDYSSEAQTDPIGPESGSNRVLRGGYYGYATRDCRVSSRGNFIPDGRDYNCGFRLALSL